MVCWYVPSSRGGPCPPGRAAVAVATQVAPARSHVPPHGSSHGGGAAAQRGHRQPSMLPCCCSRWDSKRGARPWLALSAAPRRWQHPVGAGIERRGGRLLCTNRPTQHRGPWWWRRGGEGAGGIEAISGGPAGRECVAARAAREDGGCQHSGSSTGLIFARQCWRLGSGKGSATAGRLQRAEPRWRRCPRALHGCDPREAGGGGAPTDGKVRSRGGDIEWRHHRQ